MSYAPLTSVDMLNQLVRLNDMWPRWDTDDEQFVRLAASYKEALSDVDGEAVHGGITIWLKTSTSNRWPSAGQVRECVGRWLTANRIIPTMHKADAGCPVCGSVAGWADLRVADYTTKATSVISRMIQPCDAAKHKDGSPLIPFPQNFLRWTTNTEEESYA